MIINKFDHEHDGGSKEKIKLRSITQVDHHKMVPFSIHFKKGIKT
jgi:hypothetical protein